MKSSDLDLERTHLRDLQRVSRLVAMVCIAMVWACLVGDHMDVNVKAIRVLKHVSKCIPDGSQMVAKNVR